MKKLSSHPLSARLSWSHYIQLFSFVAFAHSQSQMDPVAKYVLSQDEHHKKKPFKEEYFEILEKNNVEFKEEYLFEFFSDIYGWE